MMTSVLTFIVISGGVYLISYVKGILMLKGDNYDEWRKKIDLAFICGQVDWILTESCPTEPPAPVRKSKDTNDV